MKQRWFLTFMFPFLSVRERFQFAEVSTFFSLLHHRPFLIANPIQPGLKVPDFLPFLSAHLLAVHQLKIPRGITQMRVFDQGVFLECLGETNSSMIFTLSPDLRTPTLRLPNPYPDQCLVYGNMSSLLFLGQEEILTHVHFGHDGSRNGKNHIQFTFANGSHVHYAYYMYQEMIFAVDPSEGTIWQIEDPFQQFPVKKLFASCQKPFSHYVVNDQYLILQWSPVRFQIFAKKSLQLVQSLDLVYEVDCWCANETCIFFLCLDKNQHLFMFSIEQGIFQGIIRPNDAEKIIQIDCNNSYFYTLSSEYLLTSFSLICPVNKNKNKNKKRKKKKK